MGLIISLYHGDYTSSKDVLHGYSRVTVVNADGPWEPTKDAPAVVIEANAVGNPVIKPVFDWFVEQGLLTKEQTGWHLTASDIYAGTSDSRFGRALQRYTANTYIGVPVHSRLDDWETSRLLSI